MKATQETTKKRTFVRPMLVSYKGVVMTFADWKKMKADAREGR